MKGLGKVHPPDAQVLKDIWLSFLPGAKIGVLGLNGSGKSSLLKIMAGRGHVVHRRGRSRPTASRVGFLHQEPQLDPTKTVKGNVEEGVAETKALLDRYDELNMKLGEELTPEQMDKVLEEQAQLQDQIDAANAWDLDSQLELAMDALRLPAARRRRHRRCRAASGAAWRCAGCCSSRRTCCCSTSRPTTSTPSRWRGSSASSRSTRAPSSP